MYLPSTPQWFQIKHIYDTFGCECISDHFENKPLSIHNGMQEGLYKFSKLQSGAIQSQITDTTLRDILRRILENGVKFSGCNIEVQTQDTQQITVSIPKRKKVIFKTNNVKE